MTAINKYIELLPGFNCGACGFKNCYRFAQKLAENKVSPGDCPVLLQERFLENKEALHHLSQSVHSVDTDVIGLIDQASADFTLHPYPEEPSCRETLVSFASIPFEKDMLICYRPLGCPIIHFGRIIEINHGLLDVWVVGPCKLLNRKEEAVDVGICMVLSFQGTIEGSLPKVGQTVKFLPAHCMMGKVHSGVIVHLENNKTRIDCIDLKIWEHASSNLE